MKKQKRNDKLPFEDFVPYASSVIDEEVQAYHCRPNKAKLYIRRTNDGILAHCFHCNKSGFYRNNFNGNYQSKETYQYPKERTNVPRGSSKRPRKNYETCSTRSEERKRRDCTSLKSLHEENRYHRERLLRGYRGTRRSNYGKYTDLIGNPDVFWSDSHKRLAFKVVGKDGFWGYALRDIGNANDGLPKWFYILDRTEKRSRHPRFYPTTSSISAVVLTEDIVSAMKVGEVCDSLALMGVSLEKDYFTELTEYDTIFIWSDMDNHEVKLQTLKLKNKLEVYNKRVIIISTPKDPKEYTTEEIEEIIIEELT